MQHHNKGRKLPIEILSEDEMQRFFAAFPSTTTGIRNRAIVAVMFGAQHRCAEVLALRPEDVNLDAGAITILLGKGKKRRVTGIFPEFKSYVEDWVAIRPPGRTFFCTQVGTPMDPGYVRSMIKRVAHDARLKKRVHPHGFRHAGACVLAEQGIDIRVIQKQLGHSSLATTEIYLDHLNPRAVIDALASVRVEITPQVRA
ncbi:MAG TPA: tyrosine-type recombinase/integrase [Thermoguttaceae bacterium]